MEEEITTTTTDIKEKITLSDRARSIKPKDLIVPAVILVLFIGATIGIVNYQNKAKLKKAPEIEITKPTDGQVTSDAQIVLEGKTQVGASVKVNEKDLTVDSKGQFATELPLIEGTNSIAITAVNDAGNKSEKAITVTRGNSQPIVQTQLQATVQTNDTSVATATATPSELNSSGPESFWIFESLTLSSLGAAWALSRKNLKNMLKK